MRWAERDEKCAIHSKYKVRNKIYVEITNINGRKIKI
jgi:hypothetical protein